jgi:hypothetical protein
MERVRNGLRDFSITLYMWLLHNGYSAAVPLVSHLKSSVLDVVHCPLFCTKLSNEPVIGKYVSIRQHACFISENYTDFDSIWFGGGLS